jgi:hypothetical protein
MIVSTLLVFAAPAYSGSAMQIFLCNQDDDATDEQVVEIASEWLKGAKATKGGEDMEAWVRYPIAANIGEHDFALVVISPSFQEWGTFTDAYEGSPAQEIDDKFNELADCTESTLWESTQVK